MKPKIFYLFLTCCTALEHCSKTGIAVNGETLCIQEEDGNQSETGIERGKNSKGERGLQFKAGFEMKQFGMCDLSLLRKTSYAKCDLRKRSAN